MLAGVSFFTTIGNMMLSTMLVKLASEFDTSVAVVGRLGAFLFFAWAAVAVVTGPLSDVLGRRPMFIAGLGMMALGVLGAGLAWDFLSLALFCMVIGAGGAMVGPTNGAAVADLLPRSWQGRAFGFLNASGSMASVVGLPLIALVIAELGWRWAFWGLAAALFALLALFLARYPRTASHRRVRDLQLQRRIVHVLRRPVLWQLYAVGFLASSGYFLFFLYFPASLVRRFGMSEAGVSLPIAVVSLGMVAGAYLGGEVAQRKDRLALGAGSFVVSALLALAMVAARSVELYLALAFLFVLLQGLPFPSIVATMNLAAGRHRAAVLGQFTAANQSGGFLGSLLGGVVITAMGYPYLGVLSAAGTVVAAATLFLLRQRRALHIPRHHPRQPRVAG
jgi:predicted MFS family arabinose efflux permease